MASVDALADELERRGVGGPSAILLDAHRPLLPLIRQGAIFLGPLLGPLLGPRRFDLLRQALADPAAYDRLAARLERDRRDVSP
jgi:hypothetical protein